MSGEAPVHPSTVLQAPAEPTPLQKLIDDGLEPMYTLEAACWLIPVANVSTLRAFLKKYPKDFPARWRGNNRLLSSTEINRLRTMMVRYYNRPYAKKQSPKEQELSALEAVIARAQKR